MILQNPFFPFGGGGGGGGGKDELCQFSPTLNTEKWLLVEIQWNTNDCYINNWKIVSLKCSFSSLEKQYILSFFCYKIFKKYIKLIKSVSICIINGISGSHFYDLWA